MAHGRAFPFNSTLCFPSGGFLWPLYGLFQRFFLLFSKCGRLGRRIRALLANPCSQIFQVLRYVVYRISTSAAHRLHLSNRSASNTSPAFDRQSSGIKSN